MDNTVLLLHMNGADGSTTFTDEMGLHTVTAQGDAQIDTAEKKFGTGSGLFDGSGDYLTIPDSADWNFAGGDLTITLWIRFNSFPGTYAGIVEQYVNVSNRWLLFYDATNGISFYSSSGGDIYFAQGSTAGWSTGTWYHIALVRYGNDWDIYRDGISIASTTNSTAMEDLAADLKIGREDASGGMFNGWIDELRIVNGTAEWTADFTPPTGEYSTRTNIVNSAFNQAAVAYIAHTVSVSQSLVFNDNALIPQEIEQNNAFNQVVVVHVVREALNNLTFNDQVDLNVVLNKTASNNSAFNHSVLLNMVKQIMENNDVQFSQVVVNFVTKFAHNDITFHPIAARAYVNTPDNNLTIHQVLDKIEFSDPTGGFSQLATAFVVKPSDNDLAINQVVSPAQSIYVRTGSSAVQFRSFARTFVMRGGLISSNGANFNPRVTGDCTNNCTATFITLDYSGYFGTMNMTMRNPSSDSQNLNLNIINEYIRGQELQHFKNSYPTIETLSYKFEHLTLAKREEFFTFYKLSAGDEITLTDYCGNNWVGVILDPECRSEVYARGVACGNGMLYNLEFKFEGVRV